MTIAPALKQKRAGQIESAKTLRYTWRTLERGGVVYPILDMTVLLSFRSMEHDGSVVVDELITLFLCHTQPLIETIAHAAADPTATTFRISIHRLKGSSASIGAIRLAHVCEELERQVEMGSVEIGQDSLRQLVHEYESVKDALQGFVQASRPRNA